MPPESASHSWWLAHMPNADVKVKVDYNGEALPILKAGECVRTHVNYSGSIFNLRPGTLSWVQLTAASCNCHYCSAKWGFRAESLSQSHCLSSLQFSGSLQVHIKQTEKWEVFEISVQTLHMPANYTHSDLTEPSLVMGESPPKPFKDLFCCLVCRKCGFTVPKQALRHDFQSYPKPRANYTHPSPWCPINS